MEVKKIQAIKSRLLKLLAQYNPKEKLKNKGLLHFQATDAKHFCGQYFQSFFFLDCLSICVSDYVSIFSFVHLFCMSVYLPICLLIYLSICPYVYLSICLHVYMSICLPVHLSISISIYLSFFISIYLSICLSSVFCKTVLF